MFDSSGPVLKMLKGHSGLVNRITVSNDSRRVFTGLQDRTVRIGDVESGRTIRILGGHIEHINGIGLIPRHGQVLTSSKGERIQFGTLKVVRT